MTELESRMSARPCPMPCLATNQAAGACPLLDAARAAALAVDEIEIRSPDEGGTDSVLEPRMLLAAVSYCYARHTFGSAMPSLWARDANLRQACRNLVPAADLLRRFCRENCQSIELCLKTTLRLVAEQKLAQGYVTHVSPAQFGEEARRRMVMAAFVEALEADKAPGGPGYRLEADVKRAVDETADTVFCYAD